MRILLVGATGTTGILIAREALSVFRSATLMLYIQHASRLPPDLASNRDVITVIGPLEDADMLSKCMEGTDVVITALNAEGPLDGEHQLPTPPSALHSVFVNILTAMRRHSVKRIICLLPVTIRVPEDKPNIPLSTVCKVITTVAKEKFTAWREVGHLMLKEADDIDWTIVRTAFLKDTEARDVEVGYVTGDSSLWAPRLGVAAFTIQQVSSQKWVKKAPYLSTP